MEFQPLHDRVAIRRIGEESRTPDGILIPDTAQEKPSQSEVAPAKPGDRDGRNLVMTVKPGGRVPLDKWSKSEIRIDGQDLLVMNEKDIFGVPDRPSASRAAA